MEKRILNKKLSMLKRIAIWDKLQLYEGILHSEEQVHWFACIHTPRYISLLINLDQCSELKTKACASGIFPNHVSHLHFFDNESSEKEIQIQRSSLIGNQEPGHAFTSIQEHNIWVGK